MMENVSLTETIQLLELTLTACLKKCANVLNKTTSLIHTLLSLAMSIHLPLNLVF